MSGAERHVVTGTTQPKHEGGEREYFTAIVVLASDYDRDTQALRRDNAQLQFALEKETSAYIKLKAERDELRAQVEAMRLLLQQCDKDITQDGGVYIELRAFLFGTLPASEVIALLSDDIQ